MELVKMGLFLDAAYRILSEEGRPLTPRELVSLALERGDLQTKGETPVQTMKAKLSVDILRRHDRSLFMRTGKNRFGLREWKDLKEFVADRYAKALLDEEVVVFPFFLLPAIVPGCGVFPDVLDRKTLRESLTGMARRDAEKDFSVIQLVSVFVVRYDNLFLTHKRSRRLPEKRLHGEYSLAFGGHLNPDDLPSLFDIFDPDVGIAFMTRELEEEVVFPRGEVPRITYRGVLYDNSRQLSSQHMGVVFDVETKSQEYKIGERGFLMDPRWEGLESIRSRVEQFENWSVLLMQYYVQSLSGGGGGD